MSSRRDRRQHAVWEDSLKECQRKHSQTTCSPRAEGAGLSPGTSAHNPSAFSEPAKETEWGGAGGGGKSSQTKRTCFFCDAGVSDESDDI